jgi:hypothetical protein
MDQTSSLINDSPLYPEVARAFHIANFVPVNWGAQDQVSRSLVDFQFRREPQTTQWIRLVLAGAEGLGPVDVILRALSSRELVASGSASLDRLGSELAQRTGALYSPQRLTKTRHTAPVKNAGIREARDRLLIGAYVFDGTVLTNAPSILVLDDIVTTGATFGAIAAAIHASCPGAEVRYFALGRTDPWLVHQHLGQDFANDPNAYHDSLLGNAHLDPRYFSGVAPPAARKPKTPPPRPSIPASRLGQYTTPKEAAPTSTAVAARRADKEVAPEEKASSDAVARALPVPAARPLPVRRQSNLPWRAIAIAAAMTSIVVVTFLLTQSTKTEPEQASLPPPPAAGAFDAVPGGGTATPEAVRPKPDTRPRGVINVPIVGLRMEPSITAGSVPDAIVRAGDKVIVVKTFRPEVGPDWFYVETAARKHGWVIAPVVTVGQGRPEAR